MEPNLGVKAGWSSHHHFLTSDPPLILLGKSKISHLKKIYIYMNITCRDFKI